MSWIAVAIGGTALVGGLLGSRASRQAASTQAQSASEAMDEQARQFDISRADQAPFMETGVLANARLRRLLGLDAGYTGADSGSLLRRITQADIDADPVYQSGLKFGLDQGRDAINARAIAGGVPGGYDSGATLKALTRFGNDYGSTKANESYNRFVGDQGNIYNRLAGVSGAGQTATNQVQAAGTNAANNTAELLTGAGNARAAGIVGGASAWNNALGGVAGAAQGYQSNRILEELLKRRGGYTGYGAQGDYQYG